MFKMLKLVILSVKNIDSVIYQMNQHISAPVFQMQKSFQKKQKEKVLEPVSKRDFKTFFLVETIGIEPTTS